VNAGPTCREAADPASAGLRHTGANYVRAITARESDRRARSAFRALVLSLAPPGGALLDFGAGTGLDSRYFAECGLEVRAYDNDPQMCSSLRSHCGDLIASGRVSLETGSYPQFLARASRSTDRRIDVVVANFAPLNLIDDLRALFARFDTLTAPDARIVASLLSPYYIGDMRYGWWWRGLPRLWRSGRYSLPASGGTVVRRSLTDLAAQCEPSFTLERVLRGLPPRDAREAAGIDWRDRRRGEWLSLSGSRFMFLVFRKRAHKLA